MKKKTTASKKNPTGQSPAPEGRQDGHKKKFATKKPRGFPVKNYA